MITWTPGGIRAGVTDSVQVNARRGALGILCCETGPGPEGPHQPAVEIQSRSMAAAAPAELRPTLGGRSACPAAGSGLASQVRQTPFSGKDALQHS